jgi:hypothetical protein
MHYKMLTKPGFQYSLNNNKATFSKGVFLREFVKQYVFQKNIRKTSNFLTGPSTAMKVEETTGSGWSLISDWV